MKLFQVVIQWEVEEANLNIQALSQVSSDRMNMNHNINMHEYKNLNMKSVPMTTKQMIGFKRLVILPALSIVYS